MTYGWIKNNPLQIKNNYIFIFFFFLSRCYYKQFKKKKTVLNLKEISSWLAHTEQWHFVAMSDSLGQWKFDLWIVELFDLWPSAISSLDDLDLDYLDAVGSCTMTSSHVSVTLSHCTSNGQITIFPVHVVSTRPRVVSQPDTKVFNFNWRFFWNLK